MSDVGKVLDEYVNDTDGAKECVYFGEVSAGTPVNNFVDPRQVWDAAFRCASMAYYGDLVGAQKPKNVLPQYFIRWTMQLRF